MSNTLDDLFARDPDQLTRADITEMVRQLRERRAQFKQDEAAGKKPGKRKAKSGPVQPIDLSQIEL